MQVMVATEASKLRCTKLFSDSFIFILVGHYISEECLLPQVTPAQEASSFKSREPECKAIYLTV